MVLTLCSTTFAEQVVYQLKTPSEHVLLQQQECIRVECDWLKASAEGNAV